MKLTKVKIENYRSIKELELKFERNFQILVGINESGKSNILKAVSLLNEDVKIEINDIRDSGHDEEDVDKSYVRFLFKIDSSLARLIFLKVKKVVLTKSIKSALVDIGNDPYSLEDFCKYKNEVLYYVDILNQNRSFKHWSITGPRYQVRTNWKKIKAETSFKVKHDGKEVDIGNYSIINKNEFKDVPEECIEELDIEKLNTIVGNYLIETVELYMPSCIMWKYDDENLLPEKVNLSAFTEKPSSCIPLRNMFALAGYSDISKTIEAAEKKSNGMRNVLRKVSEKTTSHMKKVWPEWKTLKVTLLQNGAFIEAGIEDEYNIYSLSRRSDGFKRFLTFLLMISVQNKTEDIYDNIILIDEPDTSLHPTGIQYLLKELNEIGKNNLLLISTHSIFMIDKEIVDRHLIVEKKKEITNVKRVKSSNITDEEVVFKALGYSLFEMLKPKNIIFEGWRDKKVFNIFLSSKRGKNLVVRDGLNKVGLLHAIGVKDVPRLANTCENLSRDYVIITDSDNIAKQKQRAFAGIGEWICYKDIDEIDAVTTEDFISNKIINKALKYVSELNELDGSMTISDEIMLNKVEHIKQQVIAFNNDKETINKIMNQIKEYIIDKLKPSDIDEKYSVVCNNVIQKITKEQEV